MCNSSKVCFVGELFRSYDNILCIRIEFWQNVSVSVGGQLSSRAVPVLYCLCLCYLTFRSIFVGSNKTSRHCAIQILISHLTISMS